MLPILRQIASALDYAHELRVIHRDIKPSNVMVSHSPNTPIPQVRLLDFGLAAQIHTSFSRVSHVKYGTSGTGPYMAPEQWRGQRQDGRTDQYAFAVLAYELIAGRCPFENPDMTALRAAVLEDQPERPEGLSDAAWSALLRALGKTREARFASCAEFVELLGGSSATLRRKSPAQSAGGTGGGKRAVPAVVMLLLLGLGLAYWGYTSYSERQANARVEREAMARRQAEESQQAQVRQTAIQELLRAAQSALAATNAELAVGKATELLVLDPENQEAKKLVQDARALIGLAECAPVKSTAERLWRQVKSFDPGQGFDQKLSDCEQTLGEGQAFFDGKDYPRAVGKYKDVISAAEELVDLNRQRSEASTKRPLAEAARQTAQAGGAEQTTPELWSSGQLLLREAGQVFAKGQFAEAGRNWDAARGEFEKASAQTQAEQKRKEAERQESLAKQQAEQRQQEELARQKKAEEDQRQKSRRVPEGYVMEGREYDAASGLPTAIRHIKTGYVLRLVPAGNFWLGSPEGEGDSDERPRRNVRLDPYWIGETEVTCEQYAQFLNEQGNQMEGGVTWCNVGGAAVKISGSPGSYRGKTGFADHPVVEVSWYGARAYTKWMGGALPTEAQWEKAAKGGRGLTWPWGNQWDKSEANTAERLAGVSEFRTYQDWLQWWEPIQRQKFGNNPDYSDTTVPVKRYAPNGYGLYDMAGNVWEWCRDWYRADQYGRWPEGVQNPVNEESGDMQTVEYWQGGEKKSEQQACRVVRGGGWFVQASLARCADRGRNLPSGRYADVGFRVVVSPRP